MATYWSPKTISQLTLRLLAKSKQLLFLRQFNCLYRQWFRQQTPGQFFPVGQKPLISFIVPVYNPIPKYFINCLESVLSQTYSHWQLCLADDHSSNPEIRQILDNYQKKDSRIFVAYQTKHRHISATSNLALQLARGEYIALLDHDDEIPKFALAEIVKFLNRFPKADLIYSDEDKLEPNGQHSDPALKPDFSPDYLYSTNYLCHLAVIRKNLIDQVGGFRLGLEGSQDYDLFLRIHRITPNIYHLPQVLYHWRKLPGSTASLYSDKSYAQIASLKTLRDFFGHRATLTVGLQPGTFRVKYPIINLPKISIIIPSKDKLSLLQPCLNSIFDKTTYSNYEVLLINNHSQKSQTIKYLRSLKSNPKVKIFSYNHPFNYSSVNNFAVQKCSGDYLLFLNNDTRLISPDWLESLLEHAQRPDIRAVGCKLLYPNLNIQHAGIILGLGGIANSASLGLSDLASQPFPLLNSKDVIRNFLAVTGACLMIHKNKFLSVGGFNPQFKIAYNDVDLCLRLIEKGYRNLYTPYAQLYHLESASISRRRDFMLFKKEQELFRKKWSKYTNYDPFFTPHLDKSNPYLYSCSFS